MFARVLHIITVALVALFGLGAAAFIAGETFDDPGGWRAAVLVAAWALPLVALTTVALFWPDLGMKVLPAALAVVAAVVLIDAFTHFVNTDRWGPVDTIAIFAVAIPCGVLGARRTVAAGWLLLAGGAVQIVLSFARFAGHEGPGFRAALGGSSGAMVLPYLVLGALFLAVAAAERTATGHLRGGPPKVSHAH